MENQAAWMTTKGSKTLKVDSAPYTKPGQWELVIRSGALATNPIDYMMQDLPAIIFPHVKYPSVYGFDTAGEVVEVGTGVSRFKSGDRVVGFAVGLRKDTNKPSHGAFQTYVVLHENLTSSIPDNIPFESAAVLPLTLSTAATGLFLETQLGLRHPSSPPAPPNGETLVVWGASTAVGGNAIQMATAAGYEVIATAGAKNHETVRRLGARDVFDYRDPGVVQHVISALRNRKCAGAVAIGEGSALPCLDIVAASVPSAPGSRKYVCQLSGPKLPGESPSSPFGWLALIGSVLRFQLAIASKSISKGVKTGFVNGGDLVGTGLDQVIYRDYLPEALKRGQHVVYPEPLVVGQGLEMLNEALKMHKAGVSAKKPVVRL